MSNFNRKYRLAFGQPNSEGVVIERLHIQFEVERTLDSEADSCNLVVYNMNDTSLQELKKEGTIMFLYAGYESGVYGLIFSGKIIEVVSERQGSEVATTITATEGLVLKEAASSLRFPKQTTLSQVIKDIAVKDLNLDLGEINLGEFDKQFPNGYIALGKSKRILDELCETNHLNWTIQNNKLVVLAKDKVSLKAAFLLNAGTGLLGTPKFKAGKPGVLEEEVSARGVEVVCFLNASIHPGDSVVVQSAYFNNGTPANLKVQSLRHRGDYEGSNWVTELELIGHDGSTETK